MGVSGPETTPISTLSTETITNYEDPDKEPLLQSLKIRRGSVPSTLDEESQVFPDTRPPYTPFRGPDCNRQGTPSDRGKRVKLD